MLDPSIRSGAKQPIYMFGDVISIPFSDGHEGMWTCSINIFTSKLLVFEGFLVIDLFLRPQEFGMIG